VPGAFTPTCHKNHLPGYITHAEAILAKGVDAICVTSVNDVFVMTAWAKATGGEGKITFLSDGNGDFAKAVGLALDGTGFGLGTRSQRYAMVVDDGVVSVLNVEDTPSKADVSGAEALLKQL
jgi:alkyl hydroperoxide reductase subunit AhpC